MQGHAKKPKKPLCKVKKKRGAEGSGLCDKEKQGLAEFVASKS